MHNFYNKNINCSPMYLPQRRLHGLVRICRRGGWILESVTDLFCLFRKRIRSRWAMGANKRSVGPPGPALRGSSGGAASKDQDIIRRFTWVIASISVHLEELRYFWANALGISGPQWMILMALAEIDQDDGVPVNAVSKKLHVDASFVTTQSKLLEKKGFVRRKTSSEDARVVKMSLTDKAQKNVARLAVQQETLHEFIFAEINSRDLT